LLKLLGGHRADFTPGLATDDVHRLAARADRLLDRAVGRPPAEVEYVAGVALARRRVFAVDQPCAEEHQQHHERWRLPLDALAVVQRAGSGASSASTS